MGNFLNWQQMASFKGVFYSYTEKGDTGLTIPQSGLHPPPFCDIEWTRCGGVLLKFVKLFQTAQFRAQAGVFLFH